MKPSQLLQIRLEKKPHERVCFGEIAMKITTQGVPNDQLEMVETAVKLVDALIWGNELSKKVKHIKILKDSDGDPNHPKIFKGLLDVYDPKTKTCELHIRSLIEMGENTDTNLAWSICHDLAHAFDVCHGNLAFNRKDDTITYLGKSYNLDKVANTHLTDEYRQLQNFRNTLYYQAHDLYEPWEVRPLMAADACMAEYRRKNHCPNLIGRMIDDVPKPMKSIEKKLVEDLNKDAVCDRRPFAKF
jgi:hypothetical protein